MNSQSGNALAIIPARGGSKRIPRKNIRPFLGKPIIGYVIETALQSGLFDEVMVSTDDDEIAAIAEEFGASVPFWRSAETANDTATTTDVIIEVLDQYGQTGKTFDAVCCLYPTAPFISTQVLKQTRQMLTNRQAEVIYPIQKFHFPIQRAFLYDNDTGKIQWADPNSFLKRSQDLPPTYHDAGQFYWFEVSRLLEIRQLPGLIPGGVVIGEMQAHALILKKIGRLQSLNTDCCTREKNYLPRRR
jgi:pseudaminic acid cytidylyltransferase